MSCRKNVEGRKISRKDIKIWSGKFGLNRPTGQGVFHVNYAGDTPTYAIVHANTLEILTLHGDQNPC